ncbi:MAG TPA: hypothetical protein VF234_09140 [Limnochordia bacterium]
MILDLLTKWLAVGIGMAALTKERAEELLADLVQQGRLSREEGRAILDRIMREADQQKEALRAGLAEQRRRVLNTAGVATTEELAELKARLGMLEERVAALEQR